MNEAEQKEYVSANMDSDLQFVLADSGVTLAGQVAIARHYGSLRKFRAIGDTRAEVRRACLADFAIPQDAPESRAEAAAIVSSWEINCPRVYFQRGGDPRGGESVGTATCIAGARAPGHG